MRNLMREFKEFLMRGNVVDLAVAVVIGAAFGSVVKSLVSDLLTPLIAAVGGQHDFSNLFFTFHNSKFLYGDFVNAVVSFVILAAVVFFVVVKPINKLIELSQRRKPTPDPTTRKCPQCVSEIPREAKRCSFCTSKVTPLKVSKAAE